MSYSKGRKAELEYSQKLQKEGWQTEISPKGNKWVKQRDFFGYWDIISYNKELNLWRLTQVKSGKSNLMINKYREAAKNTPIGTIVELAHRKLNKSRRVEWRIIMLK